MRSNLLAKVYSLYFFAEEIIRPCTHALGGNLHRRSQAVYDGCAWLSFPAIVGADVR